MDHIQKFKTQVSGENFNHNFLKGVVFLKIVAFTLHCNTDPIRCLLRGVTPLLR